MTEWATITGLNRETIAARIDRLGWTPEKAIASPASNHGIAIDGETKRKVLVLKGKMSGRKAAKLAGISETSLRRIWGASKWR